jgi:RNA polymerase sigma-70 factor (ECF subfamily)
MVIGPHRPVTRQARHPRFSLARSGQPSRFDRSTRVDPFDPVSPNRPAARDSELVAALRRGDERVVATLVDRYHAAMVRLALTYVGDRATAEDVAQEAWLGMLRGLGDFAGRASLKTWLFGILVNCARARRRRDRRSVPFSDLPGVDAGPTVDPDRFLPADHRWAGHWATPPAEWPEGRLLSLEIGGYLEQALAHLPDRQRAVLTLRDIEGWPAAEICTLFDISPANERVLLHRARARVRRELERYLAQP